MDSALWNPDPVIRRMNSAFYVIIIRALMLDDNVFAWAPLPTDVLHIVLVSQANEKILGLVFIELTSTIF